MVTRPRAAQNMVTVRYLRSAWRLMDTTTGRMRSMMMTVNRAVTTPKMMSGLPTMPRLPMMGTKIVNINWTM